MAPVPRSSIEGVIWIWTATWGKVYCAPHLFPFGGMLPWKRQLKLKIGSSLCNVCNEHHMEHETWMPCLKAAAKQMWGDWYIHDAAASAWAEIHTQSSSYVQWICNHTCEMNIFSISWQIYLWHIYDTLLTFFSFCFYEHNTIIMKDEPHSLAGNIALAPPLHTLESQSSLHIYYSTWYYKVDPTWLSQS